MAIRQASLAGLLLRAQSEALSQYGDRQLLERFAGSGDEAAFAAILDRHGPMLLGVCRRSLGDVHLADDVLQATFLVLARKAHSIRRRDSLAGWLYGVARRLARQARLTAAARERRERRAAQERGEVAERDPGWDELLRVLDEELQRLPERYRSPLLLCYLEGQTQDEAAKQLGWSLSTLRRRLEGGRQLLRVRMTRRGATLGAGLFAGFLAPSAARAALSVELRQAVVTAARAGTHGGAVSASVMALADGGMRMAIVAKLFLGAALAVALSGMVAGVVWRTGFAVEAEKPRAEGRQDRPAAAPSTEPADRRDRFNDLLPGGAVARLGTVAFRHGRIDWERSLTFTPDGKHLVSTGGGWVRRWDLATGHALVSVGDGWRSGMSGIARATADGKLARICYWEAGPIAIGQCTEYDLETGKERTYRLDFRRDTEDVRGLPHFLSPDGKTYAELSHAGNLTLWNAADGTCTHHLKSQGGAYTALAFPPDGKTVVVGDEGHTFRVFDLATGKELRTFGINAGVVARMAISPDGKWLVTDGGQKRQGNAVSQPDRFLRLWNLEEGTVVRTLDFPKNEGAQSPLLPLESSLLFTPDSRTVVAGDQRGRQGGRIMSTPAVHSWDVASGKPGRAWTDDFSLGLTVAISPDGQTLATLNSNGVIRLWDRETGRERRPLEASPCSVEAVCFRPDGQTVVTVGDDQAVREWDAATGRLLGPPRAGVKGFQPAFVAGDKLLRTYFLGDRATSTRLHDLATGKLLYEEPGAWLVVSPDGKRTATSSKNGPIQIRDTDTGKVVHTLEPPGEKQASEWSHRALPQAFTPDGQSLIVQDEAVSVWDLRTGKRKTTWGLLEKKVLEKPAKPPEGDSWARIDAVAVSPDGSRIAFALPKDGPGRSGARGWFNRLMLYETATGKLLHQIDVDDEALRPLTFSPDGKLLAAGGHWTVRVWDVATGKATRSFEGHRGWVKSLAFSPDSRRLASASEDSTVLVWDVAR